MLKWHYLQLKIKKYVRHYKQGDIDFLFVPKLVQKNVLTNFEYNYLKEQNHWNNDLIPAD